MSWLFAGTGEKWTPYYHKRVYAPTDDADVSNKDNFHETFKQVISDVNSPREYLIEDLNAVDHYVGGCGEEVVNDSCRRLIYFAEYAL